MMEARLTNALKGRGEFKNYQDIPPGVIACDHLVVQTESLCRLDLKRYCEGDTILVLDEICSVIKQMCSDKTHGNMHNLNLQVFERLIQRATRVICLDADLCNEEIEVMKSLRRDFRVIDNTFQQQKDDKVVLFDSKWTLIEEALKQLRDKKKLYISSTMSAGRTDALDKILTKAGFNGVCVTKNSDETFKRCIGKDINNIMTDLDYFIHTPTISVGVDYNVEDHVDYVFGIFSTQSGVDVETSMQQMRRVRHVKSKTYLAYADAVTKNLPDTAQGVKDWICNQRDLVTGKVRTNPALKLQLDDTYNLVIPDDLHSRMYCHVTAKKHLSMNGFRSRLIQRMTHAGCIVTGNASKLSKGSTIVADMKKAESEIEAASHQQIAGADPISADRFEELSSGTRELDAEQQASMHKSALMRTFDVHDHSTVTQEWVKTYDNPHENECYKNLLALSRVSGPSLHSCLQPVQQRKDLGLDYSLRGPTTAEAYSKLGRSQFAKLEYVVEILTACGFDDVFATNEVAADDLKLRIDTAWAGLENMMVQICTTLKMRNPRSSVWTFKSKLAFLCTVLEKVLGIKIVSVNKRRTKYHLEHYSSVGYVMSVRSGAQMQSMLPK
ncbi:hypothetical protein BGZ58_003530 [Dissophora ornata]|nr:hypothetical protein BGZ58_003530 [Dissophora ornata]